MNEHVMRRGSVIRIQEPSSHFPGKIHGFPQYIYISLRPSLYSEDVHTALRQQLHEWGNLVRRSRGSRGSTHFMPMLQRESKDVSVDLRTASWVFCTCVFLAMGKRISVQWEQTGHSYQKCINMWDFPVPG